MKKKNTIKLREEDGRLVENEILEVLENSPKRTRMIVDDGSGPREITITPESECPCHKIDLWGKIGGTFPGLIIIGCGILLTGIGIKLIKDLWNS